jgi:outer membrane protein assembly factor BamA
MTLYYRTSRPLSTQGANDYKIVTPGAAVRFGVPFTEYDTVYLRCRRRADVDGGRYRLARAVISLYRAHLR